ncbi:ROK family transcriptional regulator [Nonomuraea longicatena]|uniref:ROK family transcriptional regulator n=2 Tax=Nonomuraea longicatena TaxID=83682 RepID=A0ABN1QMC7_9ACTN
MSDMKTATPATARAINDRLALDLLLDQGPLTAPQLRELTGLSRPTISDLIDRLRTAGLIEVTGESGGDRRGPNARCYGLVAERAHVAGVDIRRTGLRGAVADLVGRTVGEADHPAGTDLAGALVATLARAADGRPLQSVVLGAPGLVHPHTSGLTTDNGVPGWSADVLDRVRAGTGAHVVLDNETNLAAIAEHRLGAARDRADFVLLWLDDDGVGGAVFLDGRVRKGRSGGAGELGLIEAAGRTLCCAVEPPAVPYDELAWQVARGLFPAVAVVDPGLAVIGGSRGRAGGEEFAALVGERLATLSPAPTEVLVSTVEGNAILQGAVLTALDLARDAVFG